MDADNTKPFKIKDVERKLQKAVVAATLEDLRLKVAEKFEKPEQLPTIHIDFDGTEIDDEEYFVTLDPDTELIAVFPGEHWIDPTHYITISSQRDSTDMTDAAAEKERIKQLLGQLQNNLCNISKLSDTELESLSNMDPNSLVDITGKDFMEQLKDSGRPLCAKRTAEDRINLLKLLRDGAIFCSERYPEEAEAIEMELSRKMNVNKTTTTKEANKNHRTTTLKLTTAVKNTAKTIELVQKVAAASSHANVKKAAAAAAAAAATTNQRTNDV